MRLLRGTVPGITTPQLSVGMLFSSTPWHTEDHYLYSLEYHHTGAPKVWYAAPAADAAAVERTAGEAAYGPAIARARQQGGDEATVQQGVVSALLDKSTMFSPHALLNAGMMCAWCFLGVSLSTRWCIGCTLYTHTRMCVISYNNTIMHHHPHTQVYVCVVLYKHLVNSSSPFPVHTMLAFTLALLYQSLSRWQHLSGFHLVWIAVYVSGGVQGPVGCPWRNCCVWRHRSSKVCRVGGGVRVRVCAYVGGG